MSCTYYTLSRSQGDLVDRKGIKQDLLITVGEPGEIHGMRWIVATVLAAIDMAMLGTSDPTKTFMVVADVDEDGKILPCAPDWAVRPDGSNHLEDAAPYLKGLCGDVLVEEGGAGEKELPAAKGKGGKGGKKKKRKEEGGGAGAKATKTTKLVILCHEENSKRFRHNAPKDCEVRQETFGAAAQCPDDMHPSTRSPPLFILKNTTTTQVIAIAHVDDMVAPLGFETPFPSSRSANPRTFTRQFKHSLKDGQATALGKYFPPGTLVAGRVKEALVAERGQILAASSGDDSRTQRIKNRSRTRTVAPAAPPLLDPFDSTSGRCRVTQYATSSFTHAMLAVAKTQPLDSLGGNKAALGWSGNTATLDPAAACEATELLIDAFKAQGDGLLDGHEAMSATFNFQAADPHHPHTDPLDNKVIGTATLDGQAVLRLHDPQDGMKVVLEKVLEPYSAYLLAGEGTTYYYVRPIALS